MRRLSNDWTLRYRRGRDRSARLNSIGHMTLMARTGGTLRGKEGGVQERLYSAPALEKGLDILELLAGARQPLTVSQITHQLGRSMSELFRMVQVLEYRGFIEYAADNSGYVPTDRLFMLGMEGAPVKNLLEVALPVMRELSNTIGQSCHLAIRSGGDMVVVARMESAERIGFSVRIGYRTSLPTSTSGLVLFGFQDTVERDRWSTAVFADMPAAQMAQFRAAAEKVRTRGHAREKSGFTVGITDLSAPVLRGASAAAALTVPFVKSTALATPIDAALRKLCAAADRISQSLVATDHRI